MKAWPFTFNVLLYAASAFVAPYIVLYYQARGFDGGQIGLLTGVAPIVSLVSVPLWTGLADATRRHRLMMSLALLILLAAALAFPLLGAFVPVLLVAALFYAALAPVPSFADSAAMFMLAHEKEAYSRVRLGGTIGFGAAAAIAGVLVQSYGLRLAFWGCAALLFLAFLTSQKLVYGHTKAGDATGGDLRALLAAPHWPPFLAVAFAGGIAMAATNLYLFPYMAELGANESTMGIALTIGTISEVPVLFFGNRLIRRLKAYGLLMLAMVVTGIRMLLFAASGTPGLILGIQLLNGLTYPAMWVAGVTYADENAPAGMKTTAQGLFGAMVYGLGSAVGGFAGGLLLGSMGGRGLYLVFGAVVLAIVALVALGQRAGLLGGRERPAS